MQITEDNRVDLINVHVKYAHGTNVPGIAYLRSNGNIYDSTAYKNGLDGFNIHGTDSAAGETFVVNAYNCIGSYNYDDGISHYNICKGEIVGGEYNHNVKGGVIPVSEGQVLNIKNLTTKYNKYVLYLDGNTIYNVYNVISANNEQGIRVGDDSTVNTYNLTLENNTVNSYGNYNVIQ